MPAIPKISSFEKIPSVFKYLLPVNIQCCPIIMRSLRRGITSATAGGLRKISPNLLGQYPNPLLQWCPSLQPTSNNFVKNQGARPKSGNYLKLIEDPELPKLIKLYNRVCRDCNKKTVRSTKLKWSELDDPPRKYWNKRYLPKYNIGIGKITNSSTKPKQSELDLPPRKYWSKGYFPKHTIDIGNVSNVFRKPKQSELKDPPRKYWKKSDVPNYTQYLGSSSVGSIRHKRTELDDSPSESWKETDSPEYPLDVGVSPNTKMSTITSNSIILEPEKSEHSFINSKEYVTLELISPPKISDSLKYPIDIGGSPNTKMSTMATNSIILGPEKSEHGFFSSKESITLDVTSSIKKPMSKSSHTKNGSPVKSRTPMKRDKNFLEKPQLSKAPLYNQTKSKTPRKSKKNFLQKFQNTYASINDQTESKTPTKNKNTYIRRPKLKKASLDGQSNSKSQSSSNRHSSLRLSQLPIIPQNEAKTIDSVEAFLENFRASKTSNSLKIGSLRNSLLAPSKVEANSIVNPSKLDAKSTSSSSHFLKNRLVNPYYSRYFKNSVLNPYKIEARSIKSSIHFLKTSKSTLSKKEFDNILSSSDFIRKYRWSPYNIRDKKTKLNSHLMKRYGLKPFQIGAHHVRTSHNNPFKLGEKNMHTSSRFLKHFRFKSASDEENNGNSIKSYPDDNSEQVSFRHDSAQLRDVAQADNLSSLSWLPKSDVNNANPGPIDHIHFGPIYIETHKKDFLSLNNIKPDDQRGWSKIPWPKLCEPRKIRVERDDLQRALRKENIFTKKQLKKTAAFRKKAVLTQNFSKYHRFSFEVRRKRRRGPRKTVSCQTEVNRNRCELCDFCRPSSQPDEPFMIEMKKRQDREELIQYYLKMIKGNKDLCVEKGSGKELDLSSSELMVSSTSSKFPEDRKSCKSNLGKMRHQLEQCLHMLGLCGRLIEDRLQLSRIEKRERFYHGGLGAGPEPNQR
ncbi:uncharacterized protein LOC119549164 [Drosophila subpulchrella]|uniref:uncharacterized protein LOC119549164 n=1 Tax=Drosophila subpulchrella TaxID=1486046 RepID=UPI0018A140F5|nr:uncharacterized protein LOC119549164 [Drosophila subpulchrella]